MKEVLNPFTPLVIGLFMGVLAGMLLGLFCWLGNIFWQVVTNPTLGIKCQAKPTPPVRPKTGEYRIVQTADSVFVVEKLHHFTVRGKRPWSARVPSSKWVGVGLPRYPFPFPTQAAALKWVCDKRIYPRVVKELLKELP